ncbi:hypothetical protein KSP40_PGU008610 [Platanthera guangdongensis]|uniref:Uncharacterized protein n=1 Tax=Platanthera guangdongensis TaxID=2320717 RepID=A0ABR2M4D1_9ASPA
MRLGPLIVQCFPLQESANSTTRSDLQVSPRGGGLWSPSVEAAQRGRPPCCPRDGGLLPPEQQTPANLIQKKRLLRFAKSNSGTHSMYHPYVLTLIFLLQESRQETSSLESANSTTGATSKSAQGAAVSYRRPSRPPNGGDSPCAEEATASCRPKTNSHVSSPAKVNPAKATRAPMLHLHAPWQSILSYRTARKDCLVLPCKLLSISPRMRLNSPQPLFHRDSSLILFEASLRDSEAFGPSLSRHAVLILASSSSS